MKIYILGIGGTFMSGVAVLAKQLGYEVKGCDKAVYPPMSAQLSDQGIPYIEGFSADQLHKLTCPVIVGNVMRRGMPVIEELLNKNIQYTSGPQWIAENILHNRHVIAVSGTHGKTTTASMIAWILEYAKYNPGFLIGGIPINFGISARYKDSRYFVIEADEYDTAFFDKRSKFIHYRPRTLVINNIEFDHADIFENLEAIQKQFHHLVRTVPERGLVIIPSGEASVAAVLAQGCWSSIEKIGEIWKGKSLQKDGSQFDIFYKLKWQGTVKWNLTGEHNIKNALSALAAVHHVGVEIEMAIKALCEFKGVKRRLESIGKVYGASLYDDFAHHPTAIAATLSGLRSKISEGRLIVLLELGSYSMRIGEHTQKKLLESLKKADLVYLYTDTASQGLIDWKYDQACVPFFIFSDPSAIVQSLKEKVNARDHVVIMTNRSFGGIYGLLMNTI